MKLNAISHHHLSVLTATQVPAFAAIRTSCFLVRKVPSPSSLQFPLPRTLFPKHPHSSLAHLLHSAPFPSHPHPRSLYLLRRPPQQSNYASAGSRACLCSRWPLALESELPGKRDDVCFVLCCFPSSVNICWIDTQSQVPAAEQTGRPL